jgi:hypothetical protein
MSYGVLHLEYDGFDLGYCLGAKKIPHMVGDLGSESRPEFHNSHSAHETKQDGEQNQSQNASEWGAASSPIVNERSLISFPRAILNFCQPAIHNRFSRHARGVWDVEAEKASISVYYILCARPPRAQRHFIFGVHGSVPPNGNRTTNWG